jgi:hypothetical protein
MNVGIFTFCTPDLFEYQQYQRKVFDKFGIPIHQLSLHMGPSEDILRQYGPYKQWILETNFDYYIFFDIDCIPLKLDFYNKVLDQIKDNNTITGVIQTANHLSNPLNTYIGQAFMAFSRDVFYKIGCPNSIGDYTHEEFQRYTDLSIDHGVRVLYWMPTGVKIPMWDLVKDGHKIGQFGIGTTYENLIYHNFCSRNGDYKELFFQKCLEVINQ